MSKIWTSNNMFNQSMKIVNKRKEDKYPKVILKQT